MEYLLLKSVVVFAEISGNWLLFFRAALSVFISNEFKNCNVWVFKSIRGQKAWLQQIKKFFFWKYRERNLIVFTMKKGYYFEKKLDL